MIDASYEKLGLMDRETFSRIVNQLLAHTFLLVEEYDFSEGITRVNRDFIFVERNFELFRDYFALAGFSIERDSNYGVIYLTSSYDGNRVHFDKMTTLTIYTLYLMYEEERENLSLNKEVIVTTGEIVSKMLVLGVIRKKPANTVLHEVFRRLAHFKMIKKMDGAWEAPETRMLILPTILFVVSNEQITNMTKLLEPDENEENPDFTEDTGEAVYEETE